MIKKSVEDDRRSVGVPPAVAGTSRPRFGEVTIRDRGRLPHWEKDLATYFITFRLADSLPRTFLGQIEFEKQNILNTAHQLNRELSHDEQRRMAQLSSVRIEQYLDRDAGACELRDQRIAQVVCKALCHFDERRYGSMPGASCPIMYMSSCGSFPAIR